MPGRLAVCRPLLSTVASLHFNRWSAQFRNDMHRPVIFQLASWFLHSFVECISRGINYQGVVSTISLIPIAPNFPAGVRMCFFLCCDNHSPSWRVVEKGPWRFALPHGLFYW